MSKSSIERRIVGMLANDIRLFQMDPGAVVTWMRLTAAIIEYGVEGVLSLGKDGQPSLEAIAKFRFHMSETQLKTYIETYVQTRLITYDETQGTLSMPEALAPSRRAMASRLNGKKGGRPPKIRDGAPDRKPYQTNLMMPMRGGKASSAKNLAETQHAVDSDKLSYNKNKYIKAKANTAFALTMTTKVQHAANMTPNPKEVGTVKNWCDEAAEAGLSEATTERVFLEEVETVTKRQIAVGQPPRHLGYFTKAVSIAIAIAAATECGPSKQPDEERRYEQAVEEWAQRVARGEQLGSAPRKADYIKMECVA